MIDLKIDKVTMMPISLDSLLESSKHTFAYLISHLGLSMGLYDGHHLLYFLLDGFPLWFFFFSP